MKKFFFLLLTLPALATTPTKPLHNAEVMSGDTLIVAPGGTIRLSSGATLDLTGATVEGLTTSGVSSVLAGNGLTVSGTGTVTLTADPSLVYLTTGTVTVPTSRISGLGALATPNPAGTPSLTTFVKYDGTNFTYAVPPGSGSAVAAGTGLSATGTGTVTLAIDSTVATLTGAQTLSNKSISAGQINSGTMTPAQGGTGLASATAYALLAGGTTSTDPFQSLSTGTLGQILTSNGSGALPTFQTTTTLSNPMTTQGDLIVGGASGAAARLAANSSGTQKFLTETSGTATFYDLFNTGNTFNAPQGFINPSSSNGIVSSFLAPSLGTGSYTYIATGVSIGNSNDNFQTRFNYTSSGSTSNYTALGVGPRNSLCFFTSGDVSIGSSTDLGYALGVAGSIKQSGVTSSLVKADGSGQFVAATAGTNYSQIFILSGTLSSGSASVTVPSGVHPWVTDTASAPSGPLSVTVSGTTATVHGTGTDTFSLFYAANQ